MTNDHLLSFAWKKLFFAKHGRCEREIQVESMSAWFYTGRQMAMLSHRLHLPFRFGLRDPQQCDNADRQEVGTLADGKLYDEQVDKHLRQLVYIDNTRSKRRTIAASEPILSHVAMECWLYYGVHAMHTGGGEATGYKGIVAAILGLLRPFQKFAGAIAGDVGEIAAQVLILAGVDDAKCRKACGGSLQSPIESYLRPTKDLTGLIRSLDHIVSVADFLGSLLSDDALAALKRQQDGPEFLAEMADYSFYLTHFIQTRSGGKFKSQAALQEMGIRGLGVVTPPRFPGVDVVIPMFRLGNLQEVTLLLVQVKNRGSRTSFNGWPAMENMTFSKTLPTLSILLDFCHQRKPNEPEAPLQHKEDLQPQEVAELEEGAIVLTEPEKLKVHGMTSRQDTQKATLEGVANRWRLSIRGADDSVYRALDSHGTFREYVDVYENDLYSDRNHTAEQRGLEI